MQYSGSLNVASASEAWAQLPFHQASYAIGVYNNTHYYAKNGVTGTCDYFGTDASSVLASVLSTFTSGGTVIVRAGIFWATNRVAIPYGNISLEFEDAVWRIGSGVCKTEDFQAFYAIGKQGLCFDFTDSKIDFNILNQEPWSNVTIAGIYLCNCSYVTIPNFNGTGFGSNKCAGWGVVLQNCSFVDVGHIQGSDAGSNILEMESCKHVTVDRAYGYDFAKFDDGGSVLEAFGGWTGYSWLTESFDIKVNSIIADNPSVHQGWAARIAADYGNIHDVTIGQIIATNVGAGAIQIDQIRGSPTDAYNISIGNITVENSTGMGSYSRGVTIYSDTMYRVHDVTVGNISVKNTGDAGIWIREAKNVTIGDFCVQNAGKEGVYFYNCTACTVEGSISNCCTADSTRDAIALVHTNCTTVVADSVVDDRSPAEYRYAVGESQTIADYNNITIKYAYGWINDIFVEYGAHTRSAVYSNGGIAHDIEDFSWIALLVAAIVLGRANVRNSLRRISKQHTLTQIHKDNPQMLLIPERAREGQLARKN
jgi:hypothetical protein